MLSVVILSFFAMAVYVLYPRLPHSRLLYAWKKVDEFYYDRTFGGFDWPAVLATYKKELPWFDWDGQKTSPIINNMLSVLEVSHLKHLPAFMVSEDIKKGAVLANYSPELRDISGMALAQDMLFRTSRVLSLETWSPLYAHGVRVGDRIFLESIDTADQAARFHCYHINKAGAKKEFEFTLPAKLLGARRTAVNTVDHELRLERLDQADLQALKAVIEDRNSSVTRLHYIPLGTVMTPPRLSNTKVIDIIKDSEADKAGVEIGSIMGAGTNIKAGPENIGGKKVIKTNSTYKMILPDDRKVTFSIDKEIPQLSHFWEQRSAQLVGRTLVLTFNEMTDENTRWVLKEIQKTPATAIVLDLRYNTGGSSIAVLQLLAGFLPSGTRMATEVTAKKTNAINIPSGYPPTDKPLAVLIGLASASAAEIAARTLQFYHRARVYGAQSSGQVFVSHFFRLTDGSYIQIPDANLLDPGGKPLEGDGVIPDVKKWKTLSDVRADRDPVLECALTDLSGRQCQSH
ncbi:peptidase S41 [Xylella taiwanensis]|nr:peptidase S41 [Xylella taiwanensis]NBI37063.1 peptidase S41 [Xylella taiwanensis]QKD99554.1 peptidase S41 [Xylella taiwanensis]